MDEALAQYLPEGHLVESGTRTTLAIHSIYPVAEPVDGTTHVPIDREWPGTGYAGTVVITLFARSGIHACHQGRHRTPGDDVVNLAAYAPMSDQTANSLPLGSVK